MELLTLREIASIIRGKISGPDPEVKVRGVAIDSRKIKPGNLFFALPGQRVDGHNFIPQVLAAGAAAVVKQAISGTNGNMIIVEDPLSALQELATFYRSRLPVKIWAVTGSTGKTSTKDLLAVVLGRIGRTAKTVGNYNNEIGLPLTILGLDRSDELAVIEMGMRGLGEISQLCRIASPDYGVITNIGHTHLEILGSQENIAQAKGELLGALSPAGAALLNGDDQWCRALAAQAPCPVYFYGLGPHNHFQGLDLAPQGATGTVFKVSYAGEVAEARVMIPGEHFVMNALAAIGAGVLSGLSLATAAAALAAAGISAMRWETLPGNHGTEIINDAYNANPDSMRAAVTTLAQMTSGKIKVAILGDMFELGPTAPVMHRDIGRLVGQLAIDYLYTAGDLAKEIAIGAQETGMPAARVRHFATTAEAATTLPALIQPNALILVKGSRGMKMEKIVDCLKEPDDHHG